MATRSGNRRIFGHPSIPGVPELPSGVPTGDHAEGSGGIPGGIPGHLSGREDIAGRLSGREDIAGCLSGRENVAGCLARGLTAGREQDGQHLAAQPADRIQCPGRCRRRQ